ncbi:hypothetical protein Ancab_027965, partial [Ancistrocladus abbreviatus]
VPRKEKLFKVDMAESERVEWKRKRQRTPRHGFCLAACRSSTIGWQYCSGGRCKWELCCSSERELLIVMYRFIAQLTA